ncbi:MAG: MFS transporter [Candidatus Limnocylindria bacterium]
MRPLLPPLPIAFIAFGMLWGAWQAVLPDLAGHYRLTTGPLGLILTAGFAASLPVMLLSGRILDRVGPGRGIAVAGFAMAAGVLLVAVLPPLPLLVLAVVVWAASSGSFDVAINAAAMADPLWSRPARLTLLHAAFSAGGLAGALAGGAVLGAGLSFALVYPVLAVAIVGASLLALTSTWRTPPGAGSVPRAIAMAMLPLAALVGLALLAEGSMETWSAIYLRDVLGAAAFVGALGPAAFHAAMLVGRLVGAGVAGTLGASATLFVSGLMVVAGMSVALAVPVAGLAIPAMAVAALGISFAVPVVVSLAARRAGAYAGRAASYVLTLGYAGFLVGPSLVGIIGELAGLRVALAVVPVAAAVIALASRARLVRG